ncbi:class I SAM-dependent methyltransferase [Roseococcus sp. SDR]|uniref:class I SAM-dependent methyltransferase n=1 Tax=Roseococcus sp. SDR TaxID=2835532 RepID=UPI001BD06248|nr:class I SAM-dependent methyltransferase [Roseococcus sp. SDR]MBS7792409.1 class I SAM-dependent methyltransferase [Roseococcus sp. SDR]MBV1847723.1 class I SAM-dependent methyltransferase [Roseococcus sp. SDR]
MGAENIIGLYERHAAAFDAQRDRRLFEAAWLGRFTALIPPGGAVLDLGCGMAEPIAAHLIGSGFGVTGVDSAPSLIALCRARFPGQEWLLADMRCLDLGRRFDGLLAWDSFFHLDHADQRAIFAVFARHAAPGAALMFTSGPSDGVAMGCFEGEVLYHASLSPIEYRRLLVRHGFAVVAHRTEDPECGGRTVWLARREGAQAASAG